MLSGCGIATFKSETIVQKDTTYVPLDIQEQILGYTHGDCTDKSLRQRFFEGAIPFWNNPDVYVYQYRLVLNTDGTYSMSLREFKNNAEVGAPSLLSGNFAIADGKLDLENVGRAIVELGSSRSHIKFDVITPQGDGNLDLATIWDENAVDQITPLCP